MYIYLTQVDTHTHISVNIYHPNIYIYVYMVDIYIYNKKKQEKKQKKWSELKSTDLQARDTKIKGGNSGETQQENRIKTDLQARDTFVERISPSAARLETQNCAHQIPEKSVP